MIDNAIESVTRQANEHLRRQFRMTEDIVVLSAIQDHDGSTVQHVLNKIAVFLVNIERDATSRRPATRTVSGSGRDVIRNSPLNFNLYLMVAANFSSANYREALKMLSGVVRFFQAKPVFDHNNTPDLHRDVTQLVMDIENLALNDQAIVWGALSGRYLPSVLYRMRMIVIDGAEIIGQDAVLEAPEMAIES